MKLFFLCIIITIIFTYNNLYTQYEIDTIQHGGYMRSYVLHFPKGYNNSVKYPLVLAFHGGGGVGWQSIAGQSELTKKSDSSGFILVYPEGVPLNAYRGWNAGGCCPFSTTYNVDDIGFINTLLDTLVTKYPIDTLRVYATGSSNGGIFCYRLASELSHRIAAIAPNAATSMYIEKKPNRAIPIINFHSRLDLNVPFDGGNGIGDFKGYFPSQDSTVRYWKKLNNCQSIDTVYNGNDYMEIHYKDCDCKSEIIQYVTTDGGHSWPGGPTILGKDSTSKFISATFLLWEFFQKHTLDCSGTTSISNLDKTFDSLLIYPDPSSQYLIVEGCNSTTTLYSISTIYGHTIQNGQLSSKIDISYLPIGVYFLQVENQFFKFLVVR